MARPFAVFDIDGTLIRWQLYHALADELVKRGHLDAKQFQKVWDARLAWQKRTEREAFDKYEQELIDLVNVGITGIHVNNLREACRSVIDEYKDQVYTYTRDLIQQLRVQNYLLFAISASQTEIVGLLADYYGFDDYGGSIYETKNGLFTGHIDVLRQERKLEYLKQLVAKHDAGWKNSLAVGDSEGDIPMLTVVEQPIAFNPTKKLFSHAKRQAWLVVVERKNVVYKLEPQHGSYLLAQTNDQ